MNWGYKIMFVYGAFVLAMIGMVYISSKQNNEMQDEDYYKKELVYQQVINGKNNLNALNEAINITDSAGNIHLRLPLKAISNITEGNIRFLCPSDKKKDISMHLKVDTSGVQTINSKDLSPAFYSVKISWNSSGKPYYFEQAINIHP